MPGGIELIIILAIVVLLFGAGRLSKIMGDMGKGVSAFKTGLSEGETVADSEKPTDSEKENKA